MTDEPTVVIGKKYIEKVVPLITAARQSIDIIIYEVRLRPTIPTHPVSVLLRSLQDAATRGVRIRALVGNAFIAEELARYGIVAKTLHSQKLMHAKVVLLDNCVAVIGSHNFTQSAFTSNLEVSVVVQFAAAENDLSTYFKNLWGI